jgi:hypothetical protein
MLATLSTFGFAGAVTAQPAVPKTTLQHSISAAVTNK